MHVGLLGKIGKRALNTNSILNEDESYHTDTMMTLKGHDRGDVGVLTALPGDTDRD
jgi:hypothetical protein